MGKVFNGSEFASYLTRELGGIGSGEQIVAYLHPGTRDAAEYGKVLSRSANKLGIGFEPSVFGDDSFHGMSDDNVVGVVSYLPLPPDVEEFYHRIPLDRDLEGLRPEHKGRILDNGYESGVRAPFLAAAVMEVLYHEQLKLEGSNVAIFNNTPLIGSPLSLMLQRQNSTVTICNEHTNNPKDIARRADILITAVGKKGFSVTEDWIKYGAVVIDAGARYTDSGVVGDVDFDNVWEKASLITPPKGGIGPVTMSMFELSIYQALERGGNY